MKIPDLYPWQREFFARHLHRAYLEGRYFDSGRPEDQWEALEDDEKERWLRKVDDGLAAMNEWWSKHSGCP